MKKPFTHLLCDALSQFGPLSYAEIAQHVKADRVRIRRTMNNLTVQKCVESCENGKKYRLISYPLEANRHPAKHVYGKASSGVRAAKRELPPFVPLCRNPFSAWQLALCVQR